MKNFFPTCPGRGGRLEAEGRFFGGREMMALVKHLVESAP